MKEIMCFLFSFRPSLFPQFQVMAVCLTLPNFFLKQTNFTNWYTYTTVDKSF